MRALILVLSAAVVALAVSIVLHVEQRQEFLQRTGPLFYVGTLLADAGKGEEAIYREKTSRQLLRYDVEDAPQLPPMVVPYKRIRREFQDAMGQPAHDGRDTVSYNHRLTDHGWFPLTAPEAPDALDRVWIIRSIERDTLEIDRRTYHCWRVDLIDPALPEGSDTVVAWLDETVPVFGLLKWKRGGNTWEYQGGRDGR
jgi:hypothetical protein